MLDTWHDADFDTKKSLIDFGDIHVGGDGKRYVACYISGPGGIPSRRYVKIKPRDSALKRFVNWVRNTDHVGVLDIRLRAKAEAERNYAMLSRMPVMVEGEK